MSNTSSILFVGVLSLALFVWTCQKKDSPNKPLSTAVPQEVPANESTAAQPPPDKLYEPRPDVPRGPQLPDARTEQERTKPKVAAKPSMPHTGGVADNAPPTISQQRREEPETRKVVPRQAKVSPPATASTVENPDPFSIIDRALNETGNIAFNAPKSMNKNDTVSIKLLLSLAKSLEELKAELSKGSGALGEEKGANIQVGPRMEARLSGVNFRITALTPEEQLISRTANTEWEWEVKPLEVGKQSLHLTLSAIVFVDGSSSKRALRTFDEVITVEVTPGQLVVDFVNANWQWLWAVVVVPFGTFIWQKRRKQVDLDG